MNDIFSFETGKELQKKNSIFNGKVSVLITTYKYEKPENLDEALLSMYSQTRVPDEIVMVIDGPILEEQEEIIRNYMKDDRTQLNVVRLEENVGRGIAKNIGIHACQFEFIAVMDSDDISMPERIEKQINIFKSHPELSLVAAWQAEFDDLSKQQTFIKKCPQYHDDIVKALKWRNVVPNPAIMVRRELAIAVDGYGDFKLINEDYDFFIKLIEAGGKFYNIQEILIRVRTSMDQRKRRGGKGVILDDFKFRHKHYKSGFYNIFEFLLISSVYFVFRLMPAFSKGFLYKVNRAV
ncbi:glycosyltransferase [Janthinobacterium sp. DSP2-3-3]|uniref:glycosyltransferase n=1 Tax=Janthinobacterium sp. DSP2-3-3 TaxID=2804596 RepID=UPI003CF8720E